MVFCLVSKSIIKTFKRKADRMKVCIKTTGVTAKRLYKKLKKEKDISIVSFTDNDADKWGQYIDGIQIESVFSTYKKYKDNEIEKIVIGTEMETKVCRSIYKELIEIGFLKEDIVFLPIEYLKGDSEECKFMDYEEFNYLQYLEFHLTNRCNLNCAGCSHFIPLVPGKEEVDFEELKRDLKRLKKLAGHISVIRIMGGEPMLSPDLSECCSLIRELYPYAYVRIATNGALLAGNLKNELVQTIKKENIVLDITCYPPFYHKYDEILDSLKKNGLAFHADIRWGMCPVLHGDKQHKFPFDSLELTCECVNLYKGKLYPCPVLAYIRYFNEYYGQKYPEDDGINIYEQNSFTELYKDLFKVKELCDHCNNYDMFKNNNRKPFLQSGKEPEMESWIQNYG